MLKTLFRLVLRLAVIASLAYAGRRALRQWLDGPDPEPARAPWAPVAPPPAPSASAPAEPANPAEPATPEPATAAEPVSGTILAADGPDPAAGPAPVALADGSIEPPEHEEDRTAGVAWVEAGPDGSAPESHPVKVKLSSRLYRLPGSPSYARTRADRCYASADAAEADGFARAKR